MEGQQQEVSPQLDNGYTRIANEILDALCRYRIPGEEMQCLLTIIRKTYGFGKKADKIPLSQFQVATGLDRGNICRALRNLKNRRLISVKSDTGKVTTYSFNKVFSQWQLVSKKTRVNIDNLPVSKMTHSKERFSKEKNILSECFETLWSRYPLKDGKKAALRHFMATVKDEADCQRISKSLDNYLSHLETESWKKPKNGSTWFNNWQDWENCPHAENSLQADRPTKAQLEAIL